MMSGCHTAGNQGNREEVFSYAESYRRFQYKRLRKLGEHAISKIAPRKAPIAIKLMNLREDLYPHTSESAFYQEKLIFESPYSGYGIQIGGDGLSLRQLLKKQNHYYKTNGLMIRPDLVTLFNCYLGKNHYIMLERFEIKLLKMYMGDPSFSNFFKVHKILPNFLIFCRYETCEEEVLLFEALERLYASSIIQLRSSSYDTADWSSVAC